jgi:aminoglycoside phosphotransferase (APT) family kinase protein
MMQEGVDLDALTAWMNRQGLGDGPLEQLQLLAGGSQNILLRFNRAGRCYVLRRPPVHLRANSSETMRREARVLAGLTGTAVPHPALIASCADEDVLGAAFYLMEPVAGFNVTTGLPVLHAGDPAIRRRMGLAMVEGIAALGAVDYRAVGLEGFGKPDNFLERQVARWQAQLASYADLPGWSGPEQIPGVKRVARWLDANRPTSFRPGILHGDYHLANVMFRHENGELAAIVDWELSTIGDPLLDLGWMISMWPEGDAPGEAEFPITPWHGFPSASELISHYAARSARDVGAIDWYIVLACYKLGILLEGTHARACAGKAPRETGDRLHAQTIRLFERALRRIEY